MIDAKEAKKLLEQVVDGCSLAQTLVYLSEVCEAKADHIFHNWPGTLSEPQIRAWEKAAQKVERLAKGDLRV